MTSSHSPSIVVNIAVVSLGVGERPVREEVVARDRDHLDAVPGEDREVVADLAQPPVQMPLNANGKNMIATGRPRSRES